jgi:8-amino-7-oxononanoate synthase
VAARLQELGLTGQRVVLAYPQGLDFITGFFGCLYAGCVAVPTCLPTRRTLDRFATIVLDSAASLVLSTTAAAAQHRELLEQLPVSQGFSPRIPWLATDDLPDELGEQLGETNVAPESLAMLQYTSGSTSKPKGVMISHANLMHNTRAIHEAFGMGQKQECEIGVLWLPMYHDMGLVGGVLVPMFAGITSALMPPSAFLQNPIAWLVAISKNRATISGAPNFAYDLCVRKITDEQRATLDLSCWSLAFVGAEPIQADTLERFAAAFAPCGFKPSAFYPCYGMAEATLMISGPVRGSGPNVREFSETALTEGRALPAAGLMGDGRRLVSCGVPVGDLHISIVDAQSRTHARPGRVGEVWVAGASVAQGYWHKPDQTQPAFNARLTDGVEGAFLRTGDLGFVAGGELFIVGRMDDLLIVRGRNHHPQDVETTARKCHPLLEGGIGAAFAVPDTDEQRLILVQEVVRNGRTDLASAIHACREAVLAEHGLALDTIVCVRTGTIPKTSSGKVQRRACRAAFVAGELKVVAQFQRDSVDINRTPAWSPLQTSPSLIFAIVCQHALAIGGAALTDVTPETPLTALGLDSLQRVELAATLEKTFARRLPDKEFNPAQTVGELARTVHAHLTEQPAPVAVPQAIPPAHYDFARFPEYAELKRFEGMLRAVAGENPYFRVDQGGTQQRKCVNFGVYDYLGMAHDPAVLASAKSAIDRYGTSAGASRLVSGEKQVHRDLERALATFLETQAAIAFVSGHATNVTTIGHLMGPEDLIVYDTLAHNSIIQGAQLSGATRRAFPHNDWLALDALLTDVRHRHRRVLIAIEGVYSMDGDVPDLPRFVNIKNKHKTLMLVDEAHSLGTMGRTGRGIGEHWGIDRADVDLWMGTLSKALASCGGYIAGSAEIIEYLSYTAPGFVYSVGLSPPNAAAALAALTLLRAEPQRVSRLRELAALFLTLATQRGLNTGSSAGTPVIPVIVGNSVKTLRLSSALLDCGIHVQPILHPAVAEHAARLRFFITINHSEAQVRATVNAVADELERL